MRAESCLHYQIFPNQERMTLDEGSAWSCGRGREVQVIIRVKVSVLPGCCAPETVIRSTSRAACFNEKLQDLDLSNFFYAHDDLLARSATA